MIVINNISNIKIIFILFIEKSILDIIFYYINLKT